MKVIQTLGINHFAHLEMAIVHQVKIREHIDNFHEQQFAQIQIAYSCIRLAICLPYKSGSTPLTDGTQQHDRRPFRLTYIEEVSYGFLVLFATLLV